MEAIQRVEQKYASFLKQYTKDIRFDDLKKSLLENVQKNSSSGYNSLLKKESVSEISNVLISEDLVSQEYELLQRLIIENITYSSLRTVYIEAIDSNTDRVAFTDNLKQLFENKMDFLPVNIKDTMDKPNYYFKLNDIELRIRSKVYIPAVYEHEDKYVVFFACKSQAKESVEGNEDLITCATAIVDFNNSSLSIHVNNNYTSIKTETASIKSPEKFFYHIKNLLIEDLGLSLKDRNTKEQKSKLFNYCKMLNTKIVEDFEKELSDKIDVFSNDIQEVVRKISNSMECDDSVNEKIIGKLNDILVGEYIVSKYKSLDLRTKALEKELFGYPTRIEYKGKDSSNSKTSSKSSAEPLPIHEIFHSINSVFGDNSTLNEVRIAWFEKYLFRSDSQYESRSSTSQTSIKITKKYMSINFNSYSKVNKEMVEFVLCEIRRVLSE